SRVTAGGVTHPSRYVPHTQKTAGPPGGEGPRPPPPRAGAPPATICRSPRGMGGRRRKSSAGIPTATVGGGLGIGAPANRAARSSGGIPNKMHSALLASRPPPTSGGLRDAVCLTVHRACLSPHSASTPP